jgi:hypothetical protein
MIPEGTIKPLRDCTMYANAEVATQIQIAVGKLQIPRSRLEITRRHALGGRVHTLPDYEGIGAIVDAAELYALLSNLLLYAREKNIDPVMSFRMKVLTPIINAGLIDHPKLNAEILRRFP